MVTLSLWILHVYVTVSDDDDDEDEDDDDYVDNFPRPYPSVVKSIINPSFKACIAISVCLVEVNLIL